MSGPKYRTTLVKDQNSWLCEHIGSIIDPGAGFHELHGPRDVLPVATDGERDPRLIDFTLRMMTVKLRSLRKVLQVLMMNQLRV